MIKVSLLTFPGAPEHVRENGIARVEMLIPGKEIRFTGEDPDILFFLTGGSEQPAVKQVSSGRFCVLIGSRHDNSYASATEVKAYLNDTKIASLLLDEEAPDTGKILEEFIAVKQSLDRLSGKRVGLIGSVSAWLVSSSVPAQLLKSKLGISLVEIPWDEAGQYSEFSPSGSFLDFFQDVNQAELKETAKVSELLETIIQKNNLDAITVECFPMVQRHGVTACLPLARFNDLGIPAGCEGDLTAITGMMLCRELTGIIPWIANINKVSDEGCIFSHCTIAPGLVSEYSVTSHFETGKGTAIQGSFTASRVTLFRTDHALRTAFITTAEVTGRPKSDTACRTQIEVKLSPGEIRLLREYPLGNHHLILPGDHAQLLTMAFRCLGIEIQTMAGM